MAELVRGDLDASWAMHPFALVLVVQALIVGVAVLVAPPSLIDRLRTRVGPPVGAVTLAAMSVLWIARFATETLPPL